MATGPTSYVVEPQTLLTYVWFHVAIDAAHSVGHLGSPGGSPGISAGATTNDRAWPKRRCQAVWQWKSQTPGLSATKRMWSQPLSRRKPGTGWRERGERREKRVRRLFVAGSFSFPFGDEGRRSREGKKKPSTTHP